MGANNIGQAYGLLLGGIMVFSGGIGSLATTWALRVLRNKSLN